MSKKLRVVSIDFPFSDVNVVQTSLDGPSALFDFDVVVIRPPQFHAPAFTDSLTCQQLRRVMNKKRRELDSLFAQGGVLVVFLDVPDYYSVPGDRYGQGACLVDNYDFLDSIVYQWFA